MRIDGGGVTPQCFLSKENTHGHLRGLHAFDCTEILVNLQSSAVANVSGIRLGGGTMRTPLGVYVGGASEIHGSAAIEWGDNPPNERILVTGVDIDSYGHRVDGAQRTGWARGRVVGHGFGVELGTTAAGTPSATTVELASAAMDNAPLSVGGAGFSFVVAGEVIDTPAGG